MPYPNDFQKRTLWSAGTGLAIVLLGAILVGIIWLSGQVLGYLQPVLVPLAVAGITAYLLDPLVAWLQKNRELSRLKAVLAVFGAFTIIVALFFTFLIPKLIDQGGKLVGDDEKLGTSVVNSLQKLQDRIPGARPLVDWATGPVDSETGEVVPKPYPFPIYKDKGLSHYITRKGTTIVDGIKFKEEDKQEGKSYVTQTISKAETDAAKDYEKLWNDLKFDDTKLGTLLTQNWKTLTKTALEWLQASTKVFGLLGYLLGFLLVPVYLYYFLNESSKIKATWHEYIPLKASKFKDEVVSTVSEINGYLISFFRGQVLVSLIDGILVGIALSIFQLPYGFLIGLALAVLGILPFIGNILCMIPAAIIAFIHFGGGDANHQWLGDNPWAYVGAVIGIFLVVQQINSLVTAPKIVGDSVGLHPMTVIFSILFWSLLLGGFLGALMAVPLTAAVKVLFSRYIWQARVTPQLPGANPPTEPTDIQIPNNQ
ncbi:MAG: AI-2E family transporter [Roseibacillus sp.]